MKKTLICLLIALCSFFIFAEEKSPWDGNIVVEFAFYPKSEPIKGTGADTTHFAPLTGFYSGLEFQVKGTAGYTIPVPFGDNPLVSGNRVRFYGTFELSPVSIKPVIGVQFAPIAFLDFGAGASMAAGWPFDALSVQGLAVWDDVAKEYKNKTFTSFLYETWLEGTFMFDLAAIIPGDWNHVVTMNTFKATYQGITKGGENGNPWLFQGAGEKINGWKYNASFLLGYQMPIVLQTVAVQAELEGYFGNNFAPKYDSYNPEFMTVSVSPVAILKFDDKNELTVQFRFKSRRAFTGSYEENSETLDLIYAGREFYFDRIALSYKHSF